MGVGWWEWGVGIGCSAEMHCRCVTEICLKVLELSIPLIEPKQPGSCHIDRTKKRK